MAFWQNHFGNRTHRHQNNRYQRGPDADAKAWHLFFSEGFRAVQTFRNRLVDAFQATSKYRTGQNNGWDRQNRTEQQGFTHICVENGRDRGWTWVRWQEAVGDRQRSGHRHTNIQQRDVSGGRDGEDQRQHQHKAHFVEQSKSHREAG
ncbi:hypothetical protein D3C78_1457040 [compost metagenome]